MTSETSKTSTSENVPDASYLMDLRECSALTGLEMRTISQYVALGHIPSVKFKHARLFNRKEIEQWTERRPRRRMRTSEKPVQRFVCRERTTS